MEECNKSAKRINATHEIELADLSIQLMSGSGFPSDGGYYDHDAYIVVMAIVRRPNLAYEANKKRYPAQLKDYEKKYAKYKVKMEQCLDNLGPMTEGKEKLHWGTIKEPQMPYGWKPPYKYVDPGFCECSNPGPYYKGKKFGMICCRCDKKKEFMNKEEF